MLNRFSNFNQLLEILQQVKLYVNSHGAGLGTVTSISIDDGNVILPDENGNINLDLQLSDLVHYEFVLPVIDEHGGYSSTLLYLHNSNDPIALKSYVDSVLQTGFIRSISINSGTPVLPAANGNANLTIETYTLELDEGSDSGVTASLDSGTPVEQDENHNINLDIPRTYCTKIKTAQGTYEVQPNVPGETPNDHIIDLGWTGRPFYSIALRSVPVMTTPSNPKFVAIKVENDTVLEIHSKSIQGTDAFIKFTRGALIDAGGDIYAFKMAYGSMEQYIFIGFYGMAYVDWVYGNGAATVITGEESGEYIEETFTKEAFQQTVICKGFTRDEVLAIKNDDGSNIDWYWKPVQTYNYSTTDSNSIFPDMIYSFKENIPSGIEPAEDDGNYFYWVNWLDNYNLHAGQWRFKDCYVGGVSADGGTHDYRFRMDYYMSDTLTTKGSILLDFCLTRNEISRDNRDYHCVLEDAMGNVLCDIHMKSFSDESRVLLDNCYHIYKRLRFNPACKTYEVTDNIWHS